MTTDRATERLTYGLYLRVPELLDLQSPLAHPLVPEEMLFIIGQQAQELWFKQILLDLRAAIEALSNRNMSDAVRVLARGVAILRALAGENDIMGSVMPASFHRFRGLLKASSGLESEQFRELEIASGLRDPAYLKMVARVVDLPAILSRWPLSLQDSWIAILFEHGTDPVTVVRDLYAHPARLSELFNLAETLSEYELAFADWRFHHLQVVQRVIGGQSPGTAGSSGGSYLSRTLSYRFFPELWEARDRLSADPHL